MDTLERQAPPTNGQGERRAPTGLIGVIFNKELREIFRDKRTRFGAIISPLLITPLMIFISGQFVSNQMKTSAATTYRIGIVNPEAAPALNADLAKTPFIQLVPMARGDAEKMVANKSVKAAVIVPSNAEQQLDSDRSVSVEILADFGNDVSTSASQRVEQALNRYGQDLLAQRLKKHDLPSQFGTPVAIVDRPIKGGGGVVMVLLAMLIPYVLTLSAFTGGMYAANDQIAGEKERGTLETLLVSPASRREIVLGKFAAVACVCACSGILSVVGLAIVFLLHGNMFGMSSQSGGSLGALHVGPAGILALVAAQAPLSLLFAGMLTAVSTFARNQKEMQVYNGPLMMVVLIPALGSMFVSTEAPIGMALVPILNSTMVVKQVLSGAESTPFLLVALVSSAVYAAIGILVSVRLFENERVLLKN